MALSVETLQSFEPKNNLNPEEQDLRKLFLLSFQYSQGAPNIQHNLFRWNIINGYTPKGEELPQTAPFYLSEITPPSFHIKINISEYVSQKNLYQGVIQYEWVLFRKILSEEDKNSINRELLVENITWAMVKQDLAFQYRNRPGRGTDTNYAPDSSHDPHKSFIRKHALIKVPTGHPSYDFLFSEIGKVTNAYQINSKETDIPKPVVLPSGKEVSDGIINTFSPPQALEYLAFAWNLNHQNGETFFKPT